MTGEDVANTVDDDGSGTGNVGGTGDVDADKIVTGSITAIFDGGADGLQSFTLSIALFAPNPLYSQGGLLEYDVTGDTLTAYVNGVTAGYQAADDREVFTFELNYLGVAGDYGSH